VLERVGERLGPTLRLSLSALLIALLFGIPVGILSAVKQYSVLDYLITVLSFVGVSIPVFFFGLALIYIFSLKLGLFPPGGMQTIGKPPTLSDTVAHLVLPAVMLGVASTASFARYTRASMLDVIRQEYLQTARAKGLREIVVFVKHAFPNAMIPVITVIGLQLPNLFAGAVITEQVFSWPGMGRLAIEAINYRDYPLLMGITTIFAILVLASNIITDLAYAAADPRIRYD
jgi:peptide/nickel transport system permease protein